MSHPSRLYVLLNPDGVILYPGMCLVQTTTCNWK